MKTEKDAKDQGKTQTEGEEDKAKAEASASKAGDSDGLGGIFAEKETYTKEEVTKGISQVVGSYETQIKIFKDRLATVGQENAKLKGFEKQLEIADEQIATLGKEAEEREGVIGKGDADALAWVQRGWGNRTKALDISKRERVVAGREIELTLLQQGISQTRVTQDAKEVAVEFNVDADLLLELAPEGRDKMIETAKKLSQYTIGKSDGKVKPGDNDGEKGKRGVFKVSGKGTGQGDIPSGRTAVQNVIKRAKERAGVQS